MLWAIFTLFILGNIVISGCASNDSSYLGPGLPKSRNPSLSKETQYQDNQIIHKALGEKYYSEAQYQLAISEFSAALELDPNDAGAYEGLARSYRESGEFEKALESLDKGFAVISSSNGPTYMLAILHNSKAITYDTMEKYEEALAEYNKAIKLNPTNDAYYNNKGFSCLLFMDTRKRRTEKLMLLEEAMTSLKKAIEINPNNKTAHANLGYAYGLKGMHELALNEFRQASDEASAYNNLGYIYAKNGKLPEALEACENALRINPNLPVAYYTRGSICESLGYTEKAMQSYQAFLKHTTDTQAAEEAFKRLKALERKDSKGEGTLGLGQ